MSAYAPDRGDLIWMNFDPQAGHEQVGHRPAFVVSPRIYNRKVGLAVVCPVTNQSKGYPFETILPAASKVQGVVLCDQVKSIDWRVRKAKFIDHASDSVINEVSAKITALIAHKS